MPILTYDRLCEVLSYDPGTGAFTWLRNDNRIHKAGKPAATVIERGGHRRIKIDGQRYLAQRLAWLMTSGAWPAGYIKPLNGDASDVRIANWIPCRDMPEEKRHKRMLNHRHWRKENPEKWRANNWRKNFGIGLREYQAMFLAQNGLCAICAQPETFRRVNDGETNWLAVDHDHSSKALRSLLCRRCNSLLGMAKDSVTILSAAAAYIERHAERIAAERAAAEASNVVPIRSA